MSTRNSLFKNLLLCVLFGLFSLCLVLVGARSSLADTPLQIATHSQRSEKLAAIGVPDTSASGVAADLVIDPVRSPFDISPYIYGVNLIWHAPHTRYYCAQPPTPGPTVLPATVIDANEIFPVSADGQLGQLIISGRNWWFRPDIHSALWTRSGTLFEHETCSGSGCNYPFPAHIDSLAVWRNDDGKIAQVITSGDIFWYRGDTSVSTWTAAGHLFSEGCQGGGCTEFPPSGGIDSMAVFPSANSFTQIVTKGDRYWSRAGLAPGNPWTTSGKLFEGETCPGCSLPAGGIDSLTVFPLNGKLAQIITRGGQYWYRADNSLPLWSAGNIETAASCSDSSDISAKNLIRDMIDELSVKIIRFPGGCGGDSYTFNWNDVQRTNTVEGMQLEDYVELFRTTRAEPFYTANIEGEGTGHANTQNCHELRDYPGTVNESLQVLHYFEREGVKIKHVEVANEPWAPANSRCSNWQETWQPQEYLNAYDRLANALDKEVDLTVAWPGTAGVSLGAHRIDYVQAHLYDTSPDVLDRPKKAEETLQNVRQAIPKGMGIAVTEYNLPCWTGVFCEDSQGVLQESKPDDACGTAAHALYLAEMLAVFIRNDVDYAMVWHLLEDRTKGSDWKCGLVEYDGSGFIKTPSFDVFKLIANTMKDRYLTSSTSGGNYIVAARNDTESTIHVLIINPHSSRQEIALAIPGVSENTLSLQTLTASALNDTGMVAEQQTIGKMPDNSYSISLPQYSVSVATVEHVRIKKVSLPLIRL